MAKTAPLLEHEERIFRLYSFDQGFQTWKILKKMDAVEKHYRYSLKICRDLDPEAYRSLLPVIHKWMEDAYIEYGLQIGAQPIQLKRITITEFNHKKDSWRKTNFGLTGILDANSSEFEEGPYRFFQYFIELKKSHTLTQVYHGAMPPSLSYFLYHYLAHHFRSHYQPYISLQVLQCSEPPSAGESAV